MDTEYTWKTLRVRGEKPRGIIHYNEDRKYKHGLSWLLKPSFYSDTGGKKMEKNLNSKTSLGFYGEEPPPLSRAPFFYIKRVILHWMPG